LTGRFDEPTAAPADVERDARNRDAHGQTDEPAIDFTATAALALAVVEAA
jgi:hypothetical protein